MKLAIMQPYFLPYIGYFSLIYKSDEFIFFDTPQYTKKSWYERNRIIKTSGGSTYIKVPLKKVKIGTSIKDVVIDNDQDWKRKIFSQLIIYKKSPYYKDVISILDKVLSSYYCDLSSLNIALIKEIINYLEINRTLHLYSDMNFNIDNSKINSPDDWALEISKHMGADIYINSPGGREFFDAKKYNLNGIDLLFIKQPIKKYKQLGHDFEPGLSIIDIMMQNNKEEILEMLESATLEK